MEIVPGYTWNGERLVRNLEASIQRVSFNGQSVTIHTSSDARTCQMCGNQIKKGDKYGAGRKVAYCIHCLTPSLKNMEEEESV
jgi:formamidopyrimidine-DNA glycosylase